MQRTRKFEKFVLEPIGEKSVRKLAGIGKQHARKLKDEGYVKVCINLISYKEWGHSQAQIDFKIMNPKNLQIWLLPPKEEITLG